MNFVKNTAFKAAQHLNFYLIPVYLIFTLILSVHYVLSAIANVFFVLYIVLRIRRRQIFKNFYKTIVSISICNLITFHIMPAAYAELLPWEVALHVYLYLSSYYYYYCYKEKYIQNDKPIFDFKKQNENKT
jgi:hypothetical protein